MANRVKTGNVLVDAWIDALSPLLPPDPSDAVGAAAASASKDPSIFSWERIFLGDPAAAAVGGYAFGPGAAAHFTGLCSDLAQRSLGVIAALGTNSMAGDPLGKALEQSFIVMGEAGGAAVEGPALLAEATKAASALCAARETYRVFMLATWHRAFEEVTRETVRLAGEGKPVVTPAQWLSLSNAVADRVFVQAFHSQPYVDAQRQLASALADQRQTEAKIVEIFARFGHFPTRHALDDVSQEVSELRRRVRQLERESRRIAQASAESKAVHDR